MDTDRATRSVSRGGIGVSADVTEALRGAKLSPPRVRPGTVSRPRLVDALVSRASLPLVVISAPVGFGKTTLLADWADVDDRAFVWVTLEPGDGDPVSLLALVAAAVARVRPVDPRLLADLRSPGASALGGTVPRLIAAVRSPGEPFVLVLRNLHEATARLGHDAIDLLVDHLPSGVQVVAVSRRAVWLASAVRRSRGELFELGPADLAFDEGEARLLVDAAGVDLAADELRRLVQLTEGWAAGIQLNVLAMRSDRASGRRLDLLSPHPFVSGFVRAEVLSRLPRDTVRFLRRTAVLDVMTGSLCDAVLDSTGSAGYLASISRSNLFLTPFDDRRDWYRVHSLFRAVLLDELVRREPDLVPGLHRRAADWWEANGPVDRAIAHARASGDLDRTARLVADEILPAYLAGRLPLVETWLREIGESTIEREPSLAVLAGWIAALGGRAVDATRWAEAAGRLVPPGDGGDEAAWLTSARAMLRAAMCPHGVAAMAADAEVAVGIEPVWGVWRTVAVGLLAVARWLDGDDAGAELLLGDAIEAAEASGASVPLTRWLAHRGVLLMDRGDWTTAGEDLDRALAAIDATGLTEYGASALAYAASARFHLHHRDVEAARVALERGMRLRPLATWAIPWFAVLVRLEMADAQLALAEPGAVSVLLRELDDILRHRPDVGILDERVEWLRERLRHVRGDRIVSTLTAAELRVLPHLQTHLTLEEIGERLCVSRNTVSSQAGSIYRKLGVASRGEAVARAREIGLLAPTTLS
ncbi:MAG: LuxR family transcriptional regulator [Acidimicrobiales bacterium]|nr:LuxR family transcriptional regulator [Acidimicrobiales bacterium]